MTHLNQNLSERTFVRLASQVASASAFCSERQMLHLADQLHAAIRRRETGHPDQVIGVEPLVG
ncbi:MAG: hypothetical protein JWM33_173 [Caulobacteraceae bacterium]|nr:hypothetical protein [Caulobacteraceae bacterium]